MSCSRILLCLLTQLAVLGTFAEQAFARSVTYSTENMTYYDDGTYDKKFGGVTYHSDGTYDKQVGNMTYQHDGSYSHTVGNVIHHSDGTYSKIVGNHVYHDDGSTTDREDSLSYDNNARRKYQSQHAGRLVKRVGNVGYFADGSTMRQVGDKVYLSSGAVYQVKCPKGATQATQCKLRSLK